MNENDEARFDTVDVSHEEFRAGLPAGRFRVIVNPALAPRYLQHRLWIRTLLLPVLGLGVALAMSGYLWPGLVLVAAGMLARQLIRKRSPELLLHLATRDPAIYREAIDHEILEVRMRTI
jgi:hypothetical protein